MNQFWLATKSATAALFLVGLGASYAQAEILATWDDNFGELGDEAQAAYSQGWWAAEPNFASCPPEASTGSHEDLTTAEEDLTTAEIAPEVHATPDPTAAACLELATDTALAEASLDITRDAYASAYPGYDRSELGVAPDRLPPDSLEAPTQWQLEPTMPEPTVVAPPEPTVLEPSVAGPTTPQMVAPAPRVEPAAPAPVAEPAASTASATLIENDPQFRAWLERDSEAARSVAALKAQDLIRGDRSYHDLMTAKGIPEPVPVKRSAPTPGVPETAIAPGPEAAAPTAAEVNVTPLLAQLEADLQRIRQQAAQTPPAVMSPLPLNWRPPAPSLAPALPPLRFDPQATAATPPLLFDSLAGQAFPDLAAFPAPDLSFLKTDAFKRDRHGLRLALFDRTSKNEVMASELLAGNPLFDGTLNAVLADFTAGPLVAPRAGRSPLADWQLLTHSLDLLAQPGRSLPDFTQGPEFEFLTEEHWVLDPTALLTPSPTLTLDVSLPLAPWQDSSPLAAIFQSPWVTVRSLQED